MNTKEIAKQIFNELDENQLIEFIEHFGNDEENKEDIRAYNKAYQEYIKSGKKSRPIEELWKEVGI